MDPEDLIPKLPQLRDLQPFPTTEVLVSFGTSCFLIITVCMLFAQVYEGHSGMVQCVGVEAEGQWLASGSHDCTVRLWEVTTGRCVRILPFPSKPLTVAFSPNARHSLLAVAV